MSNEVVDEPQYWEWAIQKIREREKEKLEQPQIELDIIYPDKLPNKETENPYDVNHEVNNDIYQM